MSKNPKVSALQQKAASNAAAIEALNENVDMAFDEGLGEYQRSQEDTLAQVNALIEKTEKRVKDAAEKVIREADQKACESILASYQAYGLKGDPNDCE